MTQEITVEQYQDVLARRGSKFHARKATVDGLTFDSQAEAKRYGELKLLERAGEIQKLRVHVRYPLTVNGVFVCVYEADFVYFANGHEIVEDCKGFRTREYIIKRNLMRAVYGITILEVKA